MRGIVVADTGPLYAARDPNDDKHQRVRSVNFRRLMSENLKVVVPYPTLLESYSLVMRELGIRTAHELLEEVVRGSIFRDLDAVVQRSVDALLTKGSGSAAWASAFPKICRTAGRRPARPLESSA